MVQRFTDFILFFLERDLILLVFDHHIDITFTLQPLHHAARGEHADVVRLLVSSGASPTQSNTCGKVSICRGSLKLVSSLSEFIVNHYLSKKKKKKVYS